MGWQESNTFYLVILLSVDAPGLESQSLSIKDAVKGGIVNSPEPLSCVACLARAWEGKEDVEPLTLRQTSVYDLILHNLGGVGAVPII